MFQSVEKIHIIPFMWKTGIFLSFCLHEKKFNSNFNDIPILKYWIVFCIRWENSYVLQSNEKIHIPFMWNMGIFLCFCLHKERLMLNLMAFPYCLCIRCENSYVSQYITHVCGTCEFSYVFALHIIMFHCS